MLDTVLMDGLARGRWRFFGDFGHQDIYGRLEAPPRDVLEKTLGHQPPLVLLRKNCRNLPRVAHLAGALGEVDGGYSGYRRDDDGFDPRVLFYDGAKTAKKTLVDALDTLVAEGFEPGQIVVLSRRSVGNCLAVSVDVAPWRDRLLAAGVGWRRRVHGVRLDLPVQGARGSGGGDYGCGCAGGGGAVVGGSGRAVGCCMWG